MVTAPLQSKSNINLSKPLQPHVSLTLLSYHETAGFERCPHCMAVKLLVKSFY